MKLTIVRKNWARGYNSRLLTEEGTMCCLGFFGRACGYTEAELNLRETPSQVVDQTKWPVWMDGSSDVSNLLDYNDNPSLGEAERETKIAVIFAKHGVEVEFIDGN